MVKIEILGFYIRLSKSDSLETATVMESAILKSLPVDRKLSSLLPVIIDPHSALFGAGAASVIASPV